MTVKQTNKRDDLIVAAKELLWERGYEGMSPKAVLAKSGAGQGSMYHHFDGKLDLAAKALDEVEIEMRAHFDTCLDPYRSPIKQLEAYLNMPKEALKGCRLGRFAFEQSISDPVLNPIISRFFSHYEKHLAIACRKAKKTGDLPANIKPKDLAVLLVATVQGGYVLSRIHQDEAHFKKAIRGAKSVLKALSEVY